MITFDQIEPTIKQVFSQHSSLIQSLGQIIINRDLKGKIRLVVSEDKVQALPDQSDLQSLAIQLSKDLSPHSYAADQMILQEQDLLIILKDTQSFLLDDWSCIYLIDRLASDGRWANIAPDSSANTGIPRIVFFSIKGGVGRSTAMAVTAWNLAQAGKRVMVLDLDLESPGLSSGILPAEKRPAYGIADWLVEDLVDNASVIFNDLVATSDLSHDGEILVVPAHGVNPGNYIAKLGRVWMPKTNTHGERESWSQRLNRLISQLENKWQPDVILVDSRSGIDEVASSCVTDLGAHLILLFAIDGEQTWSGYKILFDYWNKAGVAPEIRERLQLVGALLPETETKEYFAQLNEHGWDLFSESLYDPIPPGEIADQDHWNFDDNDESAPHFPWAIRWNRGFSALSSLHKRVANLDHQEAETVFRNLLEGINNYGILQEKNYD